MAKSGYKKIPIVTLGAICNCFKCEENVGENGLENGSDCEGD